MKLRNTEKTGINIRRKWVLSEPEQTWQFCPIENTNIEIDGIALDDYTYLKCLELL
jgi:hypothetical protein